MREEAFRTYAVVYRCKDSLCMRVFYADDDTASMCPFCGGEIEIDHDWCVEIYDWGYRAQYL